jgi:hypothetical protein
MADLRALMVGLDSRLGLAEPEPDEPGPYSLTVDGDLPAFLRPTPDREGLILFAGHPTVPHS